MAAYNGTTMAGQDFEAENNLTMPIPTVLEETWENATLYYSIPNPDPTLNDCKPTILQSEIEEFFEYKWWIGGLIMAIISFLGIGGNSMSIIVLSRPKIRETSFNQLLLVVCIVDTVFILCNIPSCLTALGIKNAYFKSLRSWMDAFGQVSMCASVLMIVALTFERHFAIRAPHTYRIHIRSTPWWKHLSYYVVPVTILSIIFNIPIFMNLTGSWKEDPTYLKVNLYLRMFHPLTTTGVAPILILLILNVRITTAIWEIHNKAKTLKQWPRGQGNNKSINEETVIATSSTKNGTVATGGTSKSQQQNRREIKMAYVTFAIVGLFFCLNMPRFVLGSFEVSNTWLILRCLENKVKYLSPLTFYRWDCISRLLMVVNSSINFLIYCTGSDQFKTQFINTFLSKFLSSEPNNLADPTTLVPVTEITRNENEMKMKNRKIQTPLTSQKDLENGIQGSNGSDIQIMTGADVV